MRISAKNNHTEKRRQRRLLLPALWVLPFIPCFAAWTFFGVGDGVSENPRAGAGPAMPFPPRFALPRPEVCVVCARAWGHLESAAYP